MARIDLINVRVWLPMINATILSIKVAEHEVHAQVSSAEGLASGDHVWLAVKRYHVFDKASGMRLRSIPEIL